MELHTELLRLQRLVDKYEHGIRRHRDEKGDDRCWMDDEVLYGLLPEGRTPPKRDTCVMLEHCKRYIESRQNPNTEYVSPQRKIEVLEELRIKQNIFIDQLLEKIIVLKQRIANDSQTKVDSQTATQQ